MSSTAVLLDNATRSLVYGSAAFEGQDYSDTICLDILCDYKVASFHMLGVTKQQGLDSYCGVFGFSPAGKADPASSIISQLYDAGLISKKQVSFFLGTLE
mmetsp:Transcript_1693/g.1150  ORF Transcript_1693/g.1150 Transcript_1693/m.1150 type:complete len:100 (+) Transcript_1693:366-665(+)